MTAIYQLLENIAQSYFIIHEKFHPGQLILLCSNECPICFVIFERIFLITLIFFFSETEFPFWTYQALNQRRYMMVGF